MKKILLVCILLVIAFLPFGTVQSVQPFQVKKNSTTCWWCDPCDCCFDDVRITIGDFVYDENNYQNAYWNLEITPLKNGRPVNRVVAFDAYIYSSRNNRIYGSREFIFDETVYDNVFGSNELWSGAVKTYKVIWTPGYDYEFKIHGFNYEDTIHLMIIMPSGCVLMSDPMVFDFGPPPPPQ